MMDQDQFEATIKANGFIEVTKENGFVVSDEPEGHKHFVHRSNTEEGQKILKAIIIENGKATLHEMKMVADCAFGITSATCVTVDMTENFFEEVKKIADEKTKEFVERIQNIEFPKIEGDFPTWAKDHGFTGETKEDEVFKKEEGDFRTVLYNKTKLKGIAFKAGDEKTFVYAFRNFQKEGIETVNAQIKKMVEAIN